jgi:transcriptional regulator with XRE-family HTH domain
MAKPHPSSLFGRRLREAREREGLPQDRLGVLIGLDEGCSSARISRYENGIHEPPYEIAEKLAAALRVPTAYLYCREDDLADFLRIIAQLPDGKRVRLAKLIGDL